jgi:hypothetical protein
MKYLVQIDYVDPGPLLAPAQLAAMVENAVLPAVETLMKLEADKKVTGGVVCGARALAFVLEAESHQEADQFAQSLPFWGITKFTMTPLTTFKDRSAQDRQGLAQLKAMK